MLKKLHGEYLQDCIEKWLGGYAYQEGHAEMTVKKKREFFLRFERFLQGRELTYQTANAYIDELRDFGCLKQNGQRGRPWIRTSIVCEVKVLHSFVHFLFKTGLIPVDFSSQIVKPKVKPQTKEIVSIEEFWKIAQSGCEYGKNDTKKSRKQKDEARFALEFLSLYPLRVGELLRIRGEDMELWEAIPKIHLTKRKDQQDHFIPCPPSMVERLKERAGCSRAFPTTRTLLNRCLKRGCERLGIPKKIRCHSVRHIVNTELIDRGAGISQTADILGHKDIRLTKEVYTHHSVKGLGDTMLRYHPLQTCALPLDLLIGEIQKYTSQCGLISDARLGSLSFNVTTEKIEITIPIKQSG